MAGFIEMRVLGTFDVRLGDGEVVDQRSWRTAKTRGLVRLLAVAGKPVSSDRVVDLLWPGADPVRGRGSLRTAVSHIRQVLGADCLVRRGDSLELSGVWVDATAFASLAATARDRLAAGEAQAGLATAWEAVTLYRGDLYQGEPSADRAAEDERHRLRQVLRQLLLDAGQAACDSGWWRDAVELAGRALDVDPCAERAYRVLMRAHSGLGETEQALRAFDRCRRALADELGADPDDSTRALHLQLLRPQAPRVERPPLVARARVLSQVLAGLAVPADEGRLHAVVVTGAGGAGRTRLLEEVASAWSQRVVPVPCRPETAGTPGALVREVALALGGRSGSTPAAQELRLLLGDEPVLLVLDDVQWADARSLDVVGQLLQDPVRPLLVLASAPAEPAPDHPLRSAGCEVVALTPLAREEVVELLVALLDGPPSRSLVEELAATSQGLPGTLVDSVRSLRGSGELMSTPDGMIRVLRRTASGRGLATGPLLTAARGQVGLQGALVLDLLAVLDRPTSLAELSRVSGVDRAQVRLALDRLCDLQLVARRPSGYVPADPLVREAVYRWLRPSACRELHHRVAELADLPSGVRVEHWLRSGEPALACAAALQAADEAAADGDDQSLRTHLRTVRAFAREHGTEAHDQVVLCERLAGVAMRLGRPWEAQDLREQGRALARASAPQVLPRLPRGLDARGAGDAPALAPAAGGGARRGERGRETTGPVADPAGPGGLQQELDRLGQGIRDADGTGDVVSQVEARVRLARVAGAHRDLDLAERCAQQAMALAQTERDGTLFLRAALTLVQTPSLLGDGLRRLPLLRRLRDLSGGALGAAEAEELDMTWCLVLHDLDHPDFAAAWHRTVAGSGSRRGRLRRLLDVHVSLERDRPRRARQLLDALHEPVGDDVADDAARLLRARLLVLDGDDGGAAAALRRVLAERRSGPSLLGPEAAARLAGLLAPTDPATATAHLEQAAALTRGRALPRERLLMLRASAELQAAAGRPRAAATLARAAAMTAHRAGLTHHERDARLRRDTLLDVAAQRGRPHVRLIGTVPRQEAHLPARQLT